MKGGHSVGVAPQYASALGKNANCQTLVSLTLASGEVPVMVGVRLFLPESWTSDPARLERGGVPDDHRAYRSKPEIALAEIDRVQTAGVRFGCVLADAGYGLSASFRQAERVYDGMELGAETAARAAQSLGLRSPLLRRAPAAWALARRMVASIISHSRSGSAAMASNMWSNTPISIQR